MVGKTQAALNLAVKRPDHPGIAMDTRHESSGAFSLPVGGLDGLGSLSYNLARPLKEYTRRYRDSRRQPEVGFVAAEWDLRRVESKQINIAALTAFIAIAHRLRLFTDHAAQARLTWDPGVLHFFRSTGALDLFRNYDLVSFSDDDLAGYTRDLAKVNPSTRFMILDKTAEFGALTAAEFTTWKDEARRQLAAELHDYTRALFRPSKSLTLNPSVERQVVSASAELCLNANFWGRSPAVIGLQRSRVGISVAVADCGHGMLATLRHRLPVANHAAATLVAAIYNRRDYGLCRVIEEISALPNGWVSIWSFDSELVVKRPLWDHIKDLNPIDVSRNLPLRVSHGRLDEAARRTGYLREWSAGIRGVRVAFEVSFRDANW
jgi:hypothetical protein